MKAVFVLALMLVVATVAMAAMVEGDNMLCGHCATSYTSPVCGVNGVTYKNYCYLSCMNVQMASVGYCSPRRNYMGLYPYRQTRIVSYNWG